jgi:hypothetical protein
MINSLCKMEAEMPEFWKDLCGIATYGLKAGWPLLLSALGLAGAAYFGEKDKVKTVGSWALAIVGFLLLFFNLRGC